jgi:hypothetical protein
MNPSPWTHKFFMVTYAETAMPETIGSLDLKIARLERHLKLLEQQQAMSSMYPSHRAKLAVAAAEVRAELRELTQYRQELAALSLSPP